MKPKKLVLKKVTIAHLNNIEMNSIQGGTGDNTMSLYETVCTMYNCESGDTTDDCTGTRHCAP